MLNYLILGYSHMEKVNDNNVFNIIIKRDFF